VPDGGRAYERRLHRILAGFVAGFVAFLLLLAWAEQRGLTRFWIGPIFLFATVMVYAAIGIRSRTTDPEEYYVAGRRIPPMYNGMAAAADWMSAASFISMAGGLYLQGFGGAEGQAGGLAYVLGWTGGFCLVALLIAPHLRRMNLYTVPEYFDARYGGRAPAHHRGAGGGAVLLRLRGGADLRHRPGRVAADRRAVRDRHPAGPRWRAPVLLPGRHEGDHLDPGRASTWCCCSPS
jgi:hypothetical protein